MRRTNFRTAAATRSAYEWWPITPSLIKEHSANTYLGKHKNISFPLLGFVGVGRIMNVKLQGSSHVDFYKISLISTANSKV